MNLDLPAGAEVAAVVYSVPGDEEGALRIRFGDGRVRRANAHGFLYPLAGQVANMLEVVRLTGDDVAVLEG